MEKKPQPIELFYCYARNDRTLRDELDKHLAGLHHSGLITAWHDGEISPGSVWEQEIETHLNSAGVILLLVSPDFLSSDYCYGKEMKRAIERHQTKEARVIPVLLRSVDWADTPFSTLQMLPSQALPVTRWSDRDAAFENIAKGIRRVVNELLSQHNPPVSSVPTTLSSQAILSEQQNEQPLPLEDLKGEVSSRHSGISFPSPVTSAILAPLAEIPSPTNLESTREEIPLNKNLCLSYKNGTRWQFLGQRKDELVRTIVYKHVFFWIRPAFADIVVGILGIVILLFAFYVDATSRFFHYDYGDALWFYLFAFVVILSAISTFFVRYLREREVCIITNKRIILSKGGSKHIKLIPTINKVIPAHSLIDIKENQYSAMQRILNYGTLDVYTVNGILYMKNIKYPQKVGKALKSLISRNTYHVNHISK